MQLPPTAPFYADVARQVMHRFCKPAYVGAIPTVGSIMIGYSLLRSVSVWLTIGFVWAILYYFIEPQFNPDVDSKELLKRATFRIYFWPFYMFRLIGEIFGEFFP
jgi:hypothetical protein